MAWQFSSTREAKELAEVFANKNNLSEREKDALFEGVLSVSEPATENLIEFFEREEERAEYSKDSSLVFVYRHIIRALRTK